MNNFEKNNQTQFALEESIFSDTNVDFPVEENPIEQIPKNKNKNKKFIVLGLVIFLVLVVLLSIFISLKPKLKNEPMIEPKKSVEVTKPLTPFEERIENTRTALEIADPANQDLTFPPVNMGLRLDPKEK